MPQDLLNVLVQHTQAIQVCAEPATTGMETTPLRDSIVALEFMFQVRFPLASTAVNADVECRENDAVQHVVEVCAVSDLIPENGPSLRIPISQAMQFEAVRELPDDLDRRTALLGLGRHDVAVHDAPRDVKITITEVRPFQSGDLRCERRD